MKKLFLAIAICAAVSTYAWAEAPKPLNDFNKTLSAASKDNKLAFILLGREACSICNATKTMIKEGKIDVTAADYVMADLNVDDQRTFNEFMKKYGKQDFGETLPFVVVTDAHGKLLASSGGYRTAAKWNSLLADAKSRAGGKAGAKQ